MSLPFSNLCDRFHKETSLWSQKSGHLVTHRTTQGAPGHLRWVGAEGLPTKEGLGGQNTPCLALSKHFAPPLTKLAGLSQPCEALESSTHPAFAPFSSPSRPPTFR